MVDILDWPYTCYWWYAFEFEFAESYVACSTLRPGSSHLPLPQLKGSCSRFSWPTWFPTVYVPRLNTFLISMLLGYEHDRNPCQSSNEV